MSKDKVPSPGELEKELNEYLSKKYGNRVRLSVPLLFPEAEKTTTGGKGRKQEKDEHKINFNMKPAELEAYLNEYVVKQSQAKEVLATKICTHFNRIRYHNKAAAAGDIKNNILMIGPTGVGKTFLIKLIAQKIGVPFVKGDATKFSETGYVGGDVEDLVRDLVKEAGGDIKRAQYGIIYLDEIDKIAGSRNILGLDVSRTGVQRALLKPMEETDVDLKVQHDMVSQMEAIEHYRKTGKHERRVVNTRNILFIMSGAFNGLEEIIEERLHKQGIGFGATLKDKNARQTCARMVKSEDLVTYGFESEFVGRLPVMVSFETLEVEDLYAILSASTSAVVNSKRRDFMAYGIDLRFEDEALKMIARMAHEEKTGARGLVSAVEKVLLKFEKGLPSTDIKKLVVTAALVQDPAKEFERIMNARDLSDMYAVHSRLLASDQAALKDRMLASRSQSDASYAYLMSEPFVDTIVRIAAEKCFDCVTVLEDAALVVEEVHEFEKGFERACGIEVRFDSSALDRIIEIILTENADISRLIRESFDNYQHGLKLIKERTGTGSFTIDRQAVDKPQEFLNELIKESYR